MSAEVDAVDVCGWLRGLCLIALVRSSDGRLDATALRDDGALQDERRRLVHLLAGYTGIDARALDGAAEELLEMDEAYMRPENLNLQLSLLGGHPLPAFRFVHEGGVDRVALFHPLLEATFELTHAAIRVRAQTQADGTTSMEDLAVALGRFLGRVCNDEALGRAFAVASFARSAGDFLFFNGDAASRSADPAHAARVDQVLRELRATTMFAHPHVG